MSESTCPECRGRLVVGLYEHVELHEGRPVLFVNLSAERCSQCGTLVFPASSLEKMEAAVSQGRPTREMSAAVYDMSEESRTGADSQPAKSRRG
jgi:YgiT-type zinc finger domain-containing protein